MYNIFIITDGKGRTATQALNAALTQFPDKEPEIAIFQDVINEEMIDGILPVAVEKKALIVHTLVKTGIRQHLLRECSFLGLPTVDLMEPLLKMLTALFIEEPTEQPNLSNILNAEYFKRIDSMQFAFVHDDGLRTENLNDAEIVLLGVSRTFKTPLSIYFAYQGWFVANVPIILGIEPPKILEKIDPKKVFCLTTIPERLAELRRTRNIHLGGSTGDYSNPLHVREEIGYAANYYRRHPEWTTISVTSKSIEEIASEINAFRAVRKAIL